MPPTGPSTLSLIAAGYYAIVLLMCLTAAFSAVSRRQIPSHWRNWAPLAGLFTILIVLRGFDLEAIARDALRQLLVATDAYDDRRSFQGVLVLGIAILVGLAAFFWFFRKVQVARGRRDLAALAAQAAGAALVALVALVALRTVSFSALDSLLFGLLKLNWITDLGASTAIVGAAVYYAWLVSNDAKPRPGGS